MRSQWWSVETRHRPQTDSADQRLTVELEPTKDGGQRALVYPADSAGDEVATTWLAAPAAALVELNDVR